MELFIRGRWNKVNNSIRHHESPRGILIADAEIKDYIWNEGMGVFHLLTNRDEDYLISKEELPKIEEVFAKRGKENG